MAGNIKWRTNLGLNNESVTPPLIDWFDSKDQEVDFVGEMFNKYTQYIEQALVPGGQMVRVDFGHVDKPKYALFRNLTPPGKNPTSIYLAVGLSPIPYSYDDLSNTYDDIIDLDSSSSESVASEEDSSESSYNENANAFMTDVAMVYEVAPGQTIGPLILPTFEGFTLHDFDHSLGNQRAKLYFYAYLGKDPYGGSSSPDGSIATREYLLSAADALFTYIDGIGNVSIPEEIINTLTLVGAIDIVLGDVEAISQNEPGDFGSVDSTRSFDYVTEAEVDYAFEFIEQKFESIGQSALEILSQYGEAFNVIEEISDSLKSLSGAITESRNASVSLGQGATGQYATKAYVLDRYDALVTKYSTIAAEAATLRTSFDLEQSKTFGFVGNAVLSLCNIIKGFGIADTPNERGFVRSVPRGEFGEDFVDRAIIDSSGAIIIQPSTEGSSTCMWEDAGWWSSSSTSAVVPDSSTSSDSDVSDSSGSATSESSGSDTSASSNSDTSDSSGSSDSETPSGSSGSSASSASPESSSSTSPSDSSSSSEYVPSGDYGAILLIWAYEQ